MFSSDCVCLLCFVFLKLGFRLILNRQFVFLLQCFLFRKLLTYLLSDLHSYLLTYLLTYLFTYLLTYHQHANL